MFLQAPHHLTLFRHKAFHRVVYKSQKPARFAGYFLYFMRYDMARRWGLSGQNLTQQKIQICRAYLFWKHLKDFWLKGSSETLCLWLSFGTNPSAVQESMNNMTFLSTIGFWGTDFHSIISAYFTYFHHTLPSFPFPIFCCTRGDKSLFFSAAFKQHCIASSCWACHILCCMPLPNWTPPITAVHWTHCVAFVRLSLYLWLCFTSVRK